MYGKQLKLLYILYISALLFLNYLRTVSETFSQDLYDSSLNTGFQF